ncbi:hypothetical protein Bca4012_026021 [Brassica carinata]|uniref:Uncharacterized protein n=1 Tax=Brassica carinata TaxID=52824 RepID=A0A8X8AV95_BRACI|nr:hypothetical protein Bca52824_023104 [Brassica carinata]
MTRVGISKSATCRVDGLVIRSTSRGKNGAAMYDVGGCVCHGIEDIEMSLSWKQVARGVIGESDLDGGGRQSEGRQPKT